MDSRNRLLTTALALLPLGSCATVDPGPDYAAAARLVTETTGSAAIYRPDEEDRIRAEVEARLAGGLELSEAVEVALLNNPQLQGAFLAIGVSRADLVQAGLLPNPSLGLALRFPSGGGFTEIEADLMQGITDLWLRGPRSRAAQQELEATVLQVARQAADLATRTQLAYLEAVASAERIAIAAENLEVAEGLLWIAEAREEAGAGTRLEVNVAISELGGTRLEQQDATLAQQAALLELSAALGLPRPLAPTALITPIPEPLDWEADEEALVRLALDHRIDMGAARRAVAAARERLQVELRARYGEVEVGLSYEGVDGLGVLGPAVGVEIPLFDQNQAQVALARYLLKAAEKALAALELQVRLEVLGAWQRGQLEWRTTTFYAEQLLPHNQSNMELSREAYREGKVAFLSALEAQQRLLETRRGYLERLVRGAIAVPELELALGMPLEEVQAIQARDLGDHANEHETEHEKENGHDH